VLSTRSIAQTLMVLSLAVPFASNTRAQDVRQALKFMGRDVTIIAPGHDPDDEQFPKGPASVCVEGPPQRQCYTMPREFGNDPGVEVVELMKAVPAILFSAASGGISGWGVHVALLSPGEGEDLYDWFTAIPTVSNQSQHALWKDASISDALIFVTADYSWGADEGHYGHTGTSSRLTSRGHLPGTTKWCILSKINT